MNRNLSEQILPYLPVQLQSRLNEVEWDCLEEIRIRRQQPLQLIYHDCEVFLQETKADRNLIRAAFQKMCHYSPYAYKEEIREGFLTLKGGHRVGICGRTVRDTNGIRRIKDLLSLNIRIAHCITGCSRDFFPELIRDETFLDTLIISPPGYGKTTYLRDLIRNISNGIDAFRGKKIAVVDERGEIGLEHIHKNEYELGKRTDLISHCSKADGMMLLLRTMGPEVLAADEIGRMEDIESMKEIRRCGCSLLMTAHGRNREDLLKRPVLGDYLRLHPFRRYVVIDKDREGGRRVKVYDEEGGLLWN